MQNVEKRLQKVPLPPGRLAQSKIRSTGQGPTLGGQVHMYRGGGQAPRDPNEDVCNLEGALPTGKQACHKRVAYRFDLHSAPAP